MREMAPIVSPEGNIQLHSREGALIVLSFADENGDPRNMSGATVKFEIEGFTKALTAGDEPHLMVLTLNRGELPVSKSVQFVVVDETGAVPHVIWSGNLVVTGW